MASTKKVRSYLDSQLLPAFGEIPLTRIDRFLVQEWVERLVDPDDPDAKPYGPESIHSYYATLSTIMKYAALDRHIPVSRIGKGTVTLPGNGLDIRVFLTLDQVEEFLALAAAQTPYWYPMIKLVAETGLRCGRPLDRSNFRRDAWRPLVDGIAWLPRGLRFHDLRHSHISILLDLGTPVGDVASRAGHASAKMTQYRYRHAMPHADDRAMDRLAAAKAARRGLRVVS